MKTHFGFSKPFSEYTTLLAFSAFVASSVPVLLLLGFSAWLLLLAFCLMLLAIGLLWMSATVVTEENSISLEEALDLAAPTHDEERKLAVLRGIKDLEYERELGKISEHDYHDLTQRYRKEAKELLRKLDASDTALRQRAVELLAQRLADNAERISANSAPSDPKVHEP